MVLQEKKLKAVKVFIKLSNESLFIFMPPTSEKLGGANWFGPVCPSISNTLAAEKLKNCLCQNLEIIYVACT